MTGIHQIVVGASPGDAVTNAAFATRETLRGFGPSEIFARYVDPALAGDVHPLTDYTELVPAGGPRALLYHASIGEPEVCRFLLERPEPLVLVYHNVTPARYFVDLDPPFARLLSLGREELGRLRPRVVVAVADSAYNAAELEKLGYADVGVVPLPLDLAGLRRQVPDPAMMARLAEQPGPLVLFVGQLLPHKRPDLLLAAYHLLITFHVPDARLALVGPTRSMPYRRACEDFIGELQLPAWITGPVTDAELAAFYRAADGFVTMSEHEGVGVPLLEAMTMGVPVLARRCAAVPETVQDAGLLLPPDAGPELVAEAMALLLENAPLRDALVGRGKARVADLDREAALRLLVQHLSPLL